MENKNQSITASWISVIAGIWLIIAPFVLGYVNNEPRINDIWLGIIVGVLALIRAFTPTGTSWFSWISVIAGIWLIIAPFVLGYTSIEPRINDIILGIIVAAVAIWSSVADSSSKSNRSTRAAV